jgi:hypothetical protein
LAVAKKKRKHAERRVHDQAQGAAFNIPPQIAGIAAMVAGQVASPGGRKLIANALNAAAEAIAGRDGARSAAPVAPVSPVPPIPPVPPVAPEPRADFGPQFGTSNFTLPPEATRAIGAAASALERWAQGLGKPKPPAG